MVMNFVRSLEVDLDKQVFHAGERLTGNVYIEAEENMRIQSEMLLLFGLFLYLLLL